MYIDQSINNQHFLDFSPRADERERAAATARPIRQHCGGGTRAGSLSAMPVASTRNSTM